MRSTDSKGVIVDTLCESGQKVIDSRGVTIDPVADTGQEAVEILGFTTDNAGTSNGREPVVVPAGGQSTQTSPFLSPAVDRPSPASHSGVNIPSPTVPTTVPMISLRVDAPAFQPNPSTPHTMSSTAMDPAKPGGAGIGVPPPTSGMATLDTWSAVLLAQQLPSLANFSGDQVDGDGESIGDWLEHLELVAATCRWEEQAKLVNVVARLRGPASRFYWSCTPQQRSSYSSLVAALRERFTPVRLQSVQSSKFHEQKQRPDERVDDYAQDLRKLFFKAYAIAQDPGSGAKAMGRSVLAYQFGAGLKDKLKSKLVGQSGTFEELLSKARFEEARQREITASNTTNSTLTKARHSRPSPSKPKTRGKDHIPGKKEQTCYSCGGAGHFQRECLLKGCGLPAESPGGGEEKSR